MPYPQLHQPSSLHYCRFRIAADQLEQLVPTLGAGNGTVLSL